ncbi:hypothetical protein E3P99_02194 [Wallemia hederae]|uniref:Glycosyltransferase family 69 protein n=1 Tax=Wallemia hederae TaxID=1540922 RepID=A0A4T0FM83_9BASI|nr:hypothetical protein E3P99_02194 [Wallemia hederae]
MRAREYTKAITLTLITVTATACVWFYFGFPSSLLLYLTLLLITTPVYILLQLLTFNQVKKSPSKLITLAFTTLTFLYLITLPTYPLSGPGSELNVQNPINNSSSTYFFSANFYNNEDVLPHFFNEFVQLSDYLGRSNVYLSIYESNSKDKTKDLLHEFDHTLNELMIPHTIITDPSTQKPFFVGNERINYLASVRNFTLAPLTPQLDAEFNHFNKVVFLNDVFYDWFSVVRLLNTLNGEYDQVCAFDYFKIGLYDTWVTRDTCNRRVKPTYSHWQDKHSIKLLRQGKPIPVNSCWNGITAFDAKWFVQGRDDSITPIRFRVLDECVTSECLLSSYDLHLKSNKQPEIYMNPLVPTAYEKSIFLLRARLLNLSITRPYLTYRYWFEERLFGWLTAFGRKEEACAEWLQEWKTEKCRLS